jgi:DNA-binding MarR family transcriptional regulator
MHTLVGAEAERHGLSLRDHIVLSALHKTGDLTQVELGQALGMDKTTLTAEIDRLERMELVSRRVNPRDRRARIVAITPKGDAARTAIAAGAEAREADAVRSIPAAEVAQLRRALYSIIGSGEDPGSCI